MTSYAVTNQKVELCDTKQLISNNFVVDKQTVSGKETLDKKLAIKVKKTTSGKGKKVNVEHLKKSCRFKSNVQELDHPMRY